MTSTMFDAVLATARILGGMSSGTATGGTTTTLIDTTRLEGNDYFNHGTALIITNSEWSRISDWVLSTTTATLSSTLTAIAATNTYAIIPPRFPLDSILAKINAVLTGILIPDTDTTSIDTASNQTEYDLPSTIPANDLRRVWYQTNTDDANDNQWHEIRDWEVKHTATGSVDVLVLPQLTADRDIRLDYVKPHPALYTAAGEINEQIHLDRIKYAAAVLMYADEISQAAQTQGAYKYSRDMANLWGNQAERAEMMHPIHLPPLNGKIVIYGTTGSQYTGEVGKVRL